MPMKVTTVRLTDQLWSLLEAQALVEATSASELIREGAMMRLGYSLGKLGREAVAAESSVLSGEAAPFTDFGSAASGVLDLVHPRLGFWASLVTRIEGDQWVIEQARDEGYGIKAGDAYALADTYCSKMFEGLGPRFAPESRDVPCYASAAIGKKLPIAAYIGVPLLRSDGSLYGTLCAIDPAPQAPTVSSELPLLEVSGRLLSSLLEKDAEERRN
jgi:GAF domain